MELTSHDRKIFGIFDRRKSREQARSSDIGEDREEWGKMIELTGVNAKAAAFVYALDKMPQEKRDDVLRSLDPMLALFAPRWDAEGTPDMLDAMSEDDDPDRHPADPGMTDEEVETLGAEFDEELDALEEDDGFDPDEEAEGEEQAAASNVVPWDADAA